MLAAVQQNHRQTVAELGPQPGIAGRRQRVDVGRGQLEAQLTGQFRQPARGPGRRCCSRRGSAAPPAGGRGAGSWSPVCIGRRAGRPRSPRWPQGELWGLAELVRLPLWPLTTRLRVDPLVMQGFAEARARCRRGSAEPAGRARRSGRRDAGRLAGRIGKRLRLGMGAVASRGRRGRGGLVDPGDGW